MPAHTTSAAPVGPDVPVTAPVARMGDRALFPDLEARAYLAHAAVSPPSLPVRAAARAVLDDYARRGAEAFPTWIAQRTRLRGKLASLVGAGPDDVALSPNTTRGVTDVALCFPWRAGDRVVLFEGEFPANVTPWQRAAGLYGLETVFLTAREHLDAPDRALSRLEDSLRRGVRLVAVSAVQFQTGHRMPLGAIGTLCHAHGAALFVDAVQAVGAVPLDVSADSIDFLAAGCHKWLMAPEGAGMLYVHPRWARELRPHVAGWLSHEDPVGFLSRGAGHLRYDRPIRPRADMVEGGNSNTAGCAALEASVDILASLGVAAIHRHANAILDALEPGLVARGFQSLRSPDPAGRSCILGVLAPAGVDGLAVQRALTARGVACSVPDGVLRFAPHWPNAPAEVPTVLDAVDSALAELRRT